VPYWHALRTHRLLIAAVTTLALLVALLLVVTATKRYEATADLQIQPRGAFTAGDPLQGSPVFFQPADGSSAAVAAARVFSSEEYLGRFHDSSLYRQADPHGQKVSLAVVPLSQADILAIQASGPSAALVSNVANAFASFVVSQRRVIFQTWLLQKIKDLQGAMRGLPHQSVQYADLVGTVSTLRGYRGPTTARGCSPSACPGGDPTVLFLTSASAPTAASWPRPKSTLGVALIVGLLLGIAGAVTLEVLSPRFTREEELTQAHRLPVLARIPRLPARAVEGYFLGRGPLPREAWKAYRTLRAVLATAGGEGDRFPASIAVTSAGPGDGKTLTAVNLAIALSSAGLNVTLVDADLPRPMVGTVFNIVGHREGVVHLLNNPDSPRTGSVAAPLHARLQLLLASEEQMHELHLFDTQRVKDLLRRLARDSDVVVIDTPPLPEVAEAVAFADAAEAVVVCVRVGHTRRDKLADLRELLGRRGVTPLGFFVTSRRGPGRGGKHAYEGYPGDLPVIPGDYLLSPEDPLPSSERS
jgi:Mrp family chromosome partitioning ATPase